MKFWDSSALVPLLVREDSTQELADLYLQDQVVAWWGAEVECASAVACLERAGDLEAKDSNEAFRRLRGLADSWVLVEPTELIKETAKRLLRAHDLRAEDSLQLAAAVIAAEQRPASLEFVCRDNRLTTAAEREGFVTA